MAVSGSEIGNADRADVEGGVDGREFVDQGDDMEGVAQPALA